MEWKQGVLIGTPQEFKEFLGKEANKSERKQFDKAIKSIKPYKVKLPQKNKQWSSQEDAYLRANWISGKKGKPHSNNKRIARNLGRSFEGCRIRLSQLKNPFKKRIVLYKKQ